MRKKVKVMVLILSILIMNFLLVKVLQKKNNPLKLIGMLSDLIQKLIHKIFRL